MTTYLDTLDQTKVSDVLEKVKALGDWPEWVERHNGDEMFALYMRVIDTKCSKLTGLSVYDLEDFLWHDAYLDGTTPREALTEALRFAGYLA